MTYTYSCEKHGLYDIQSGADDNACPKCQPEQVNTITDPNDLKLQRIAELEFELVEARYVIKELLRDHADVGDGLGKTYMCRHCHQEALLSDPIVHAQDCVVEEARRLIGEVVG